MVTHRFFRDFSSAVFPLLFLPSLSLGLIGKEAQAQRSLVAARTVSSAAETELVDAGAVPASQPMHLTVRLAPSGERAAVLDQLLANQIDVSSAKFHHWLTPDQYAASYGVTSEQLYATTSWLESQGLKVDGVSPAHTRVFVSGTVAQVQSAFSVTLRNYNVSGVQHYASRGLPSVPKAVASSVAEISGLDDLPAVSRTRVVAMNTAGVSTDLSSEATDPLDAVATAIEANTAPILTVAASDCTAAPSAADYEAYRALFRQASAQGITVLTASSCGDQADAATPRNLANATAVVTSPLAEAIEATDGRPFWQAAPGLPADQLRHSPDVSVTSVEALAKTISTIVDETGSRQGNVNANLYALASTPDLYTQADGQNGTWEPETGLGTVDLQTLLKVYPRATGAISTATSLIADTYSVKYGTPITLTSSVLPASYAASNPSGTVTFTSASGAIGSSAITNGTATFTISNLSVGTYSVTATYSGDTNYASSTSTSSIVITVSIVNATVTATVAPAQSVPYGSTATVTATVTMGTSAAAPSGTVSSQIQSVTGSLSTATLSPNPGGNSATANIVLNAPPPGGSPYTIETTCAGNQNFQCQTPALIKNFTTVKGYTTTTVTTSPQAPQAGEAITFTATVNNSGNGTGTYNFSGNVSFYDNGVLFATAPVATNIATTSKALAGNVLHSITAKYSGDANWNTSTSSPQSVQPTLLPANLTLSSNASQSTTLAGINLILTASVYTTATSAIGPTGNVIFYDTFNGTVIQLGTATAVTPNGPNQSIAVFSTTGLLAGSHSIYAVFNGDANFTTATSSTLSITVADYTLTKVPQTLTLKAGQTGKAVILLGMVGGFGGSVTFGCTPPPSSATTCSFSPVTLNGGGTTTLTITTTAATTTTKTAGSRNLINTWNLFGGTALATLFWFAAPRRRTSLSRLLLILAAVAITANLGCGSGLDKGTGSSGSTGSGGSTSTDSGTPLGTQNVIITTAGTDGVNTVRHTDQLQVTVQ
jgi:hypothetical protein